MKQHDINSNLEAEIFSRTFTVLPPSVLYRQGKYIFAVVEFDGFVDNYFIDKRRYKRKTATLRKNLKLT